jgi:hypothetical protein
LAVDGPSSPIEGGQRPIHRLRERGRRAVPVVFALPGSVTIPPVGRAKASHLKPIRAGGISRITTVKSQLAAGP